MTALLIQKAMLEAVARALGEDLLDQVVFVGGCTTGLLLTDNVVLNQVRHTDDVDLVVQVLGKAQYYSLQKRLSEKGFKPDPEGPICAMRFNDLRVDLMPDNSEILGFSNRWYPESIATASEYVLTEELSIRILRPDLFVATKLEAWKGRGGNDVLGSRDLEDLLTLIDGRPEITAEVNASSMELKDYISREVCKLTSHPQFDYAIQSNCQGGAQRLAAMRDRINRLIRQWP